MKFQNQTQVAMITNCPNRQKRPRGDPLPVKYD